MKTVFSVFDRNKVLVCFSKGPGELICSEEGLWTGDVPSCMPKPCGMPLTLANADVEFSSPDGYTLGYGSVANYRCKAGYVSQRKGFLKCDKDGQWRGEVYPCSQVGAMLTIVQ